ncbi:hypothetical protein CRUP_012439, partial [Coryphaenoides rupestris]
MGSDCLPEPWTSMSDAQLTEMVSLFTLESETVDWRRFLLSAALPWPLPTLPQLLLLLQAFRTVTRAPRAPSAGTSIYSETAPPVPEDPTEPLPYYSLANLRKLFFQMFADHSSNPPCLDYTLMLSYLAAHPEPGLGFIRALGLVLRRPLRHPAACQFVKSMPNINEAPEPGSLGHRAEEEEEDVPQGAGGRGGEQGVPITALPRLVLLWAWDVQTTDTPRAKTREEHPL